MPQFPMVLTYAAPFFFIAVLIEWGLISWRKANGDYTPRDTIASMTMGLGNLASNLLFGFISLGILMWGWQFRLFDFGYSIWTLIAALIAQDFIYYWKHRAYHRVRWFWSAHVVHHSSEHYNLSTALRQPWNNHFIGLALLSTPLTFLGFHPALIGFVGGLNLIYQFWIHTETIHKCPRWFEAIFNTPSHHRVHHGTNARYLDSNFAGIFIIWDKIFGTFVAERPTDPVRYGIIQPVESYNPLKIAFSEWVAVFKDVSQPGLKLSQRLHYLFDWPGYSHDGSRQSSLDIKRAYVADHPGQAGEAGLPLAKAVK